MNPTIVTVSRNGHIFNPIASQLAAQGVSWVRSNPGESAVAAIGRHMPDLVIVDSGTETEARVLESVNQVKERYPAIPIFLIARKSSESLAIGALKAGVDDYFIHPFFAEDLIEVIERQLFAHAEERKSAVGSDGFSVRMVGDSRAMQDLKGMLERVSVVDSTVLITGETGTGKELAAEMIHLNSRRKKNPLIRINCSALPDSLVESELFGYERGAFTGAVTAQKGKLTAASGGGVFFDEIGDMKPFAQAKILRSIELKEVYPLGSNHSVPQDFRIIAATNRNPEQLVADGKFRKDLYYRLNVARVHLPPLRERKQDISELAAFAIENLNRRFRRQIHGVTQEAMACLMRYDWPGNVRELMNLLEATYINLPRRMIVLEDLPKTFLSNLSAADGNSSNERNHILSALENTKWNKATAARNLNWSRMTLYRKITKYNIVKKRNPPR